MIGTRSKLGAWLLAPFLFSAAIAAVDDPAVKKSRAGICYSQGTAIYRATRHFDPYDTMEACLRSGGRLPKGTNWPPGSRPETGEPLHDEMSTRQKWALGVGILTLFVLGYYWWTGIKRRPH